MSEMKYVLQRPAKKRNGYSRLERSNKVSDTSDRTTYSNLSKAYFIEENSDGRVIGVKIGRTQPDPVGVVREHLRVGTVSKKPVRVKPHKRRRTGPRGNLAIVSDGAVEDIAEDMEKRTSRAIRVIGRSRGF